MQTLVANVLAAWRRAERLAEELPPGRERDAAALAALRLRDVYHELTEARASGEVAAAGLVSEALALVEETNASA